MNESVTMATLFSTPAIARKQCQISSVSPEKMGAPIFAVMLSEVMQDSDLKSSPAMPLPNFSSQLTEDLGQTASDQDSVQGHCSDCEEKKGDESSISEQEAADGELLLAGWMMQYSNPLQSRPESAISDEPVATGNIEATIPLSQDNISEAEGSLFTSSAVSTPYVTQSGERGKMASVELRVENENAFGDMSSMVVDSETMPSEERERPSHPLRTAQEETHRAETVAEERFVLVKQSSTGFTEDNHRREGYKIPQSDFIAKFSSAFRGSSLRNEHGDVRQESGIAGTEPILLKAASLMDLPKVPADVRFERWASPVLTVPPMKASVDGSLGLSHNGVPSISAESIEVPMVENETTLLSEMPLEETAETPLNPRGNGEILQTLLSEPDRIKSIEVQGENAQPIGGNIQSIAPVNDRSSTTSEVQHAQREIPYQPQEVVSQIIQGAHIAVRDGAVEMKLRLQPAELGRVELKIIYEKDVVNTHFVAESEAVRKIIETHLPQLRNALQESGLHADNFSVSVNDGWSSSENRHFGQENQAYRSTSKNHDWKDAGSEQEVMPRESLWTGRINLKA